MIPALVVDCDPGLDDVIALAALADDHHAGRRRLAGLVAVAGNVGRDRCAANARLALDRLGLDDLAVHLGADGPLGSVEPVHAGGFHGGDGLAGLATRFGAADHIRAPEGHDPGATLAGRIRAAATDGPVDLLMLGPLTDLALALAVDPGLTEVLDRIVAMGGAFGTPLRGLATSVSPWGNSTEVAEFNVHADPIAADRVFAAGLPLTLVPLDVTRRVLLRDEDADAVTAAGADELVTTLLRAGIERQRTQTGLAGMAAHDPLAALVVTGPGLVRTESRSVRVPASGERRGACEAADDGRPPISVAMDVDVPAARSALLERLGPS